MSAGVGVSIIGCYSLQRAVRDVVCSLEEHAALPDELSSLPSLRELVMSGTNLTLKQALRRRTMARTAQSRPLRVVSYDD
jgi:hypothetical protein